MYFHPDMDIIILKEVVALKPYRYQEKWNEVADNANAAIKINQPFMKDISVRSIQDHINVLLRHDKSENVKELKKWAQE